ncbi:hypothetical protein ACFFOS_12260 [Nocardioides kongjuensis]|uniref:Uncharacterized protein n=1 Tax=Nocardioides kongjuensis TaxID=349522 RepID=A0A852RW02_9ACTN|nr:hypothetical protein [Nocardioides kongjuensis]NYD30742.1 hypothetical protein [Nocardioides kongjuensis]
MGTFVRWIQLAVLTALVGATLSVVAAPARAAGRTCVEDVEYVLEAQGMTCRFAKRLIADAGDIGQAQYESSECAHANDTGGECQAYRTTFRQGRFRCTYRYYPWDYITRTVCRHVGKPKRRWAREESA